MSPHTMSLPTTDIRLQACLDLTHLKEPCLREDIDRVVAEAEHGSPVACLCIPSLWLKHAHQKAPALRLATVVNFPEGQHSLSHVRAEIREALAHGAHEIDLVLPYTKVLSGQPASIQAFVASCRAAAPDAILKTILETGAFAPTSEHDALLCSMAQDALKGGADFLKTSTGTTPTGATLHAVRLLIAVLIQHQNTTGYLKGLKISGGLAGEKEAAPYVNYIKKVLGDGYVHPKTFRIGSSKWFHNKPHGDDCY